MCWTQNICETAITDDSRTVPNIKKNTLDVFDYIDKLFLTLWKCMYCQCLTSKLPVCNQCFVIFASAYFKSTYHFIWCFNCLTSYNLILIQSHPASYFLLTLLSLCLPVFCV